MHDEPIVQGADWLLVADIDEFLNVHIGDHSARALAEAAPENVDLIALSWKNFGAGAHEVFPAGFVSENFTIGVHGNDFRNAGIKSFIRQPKRFLRINCHNPRQFQGGYPLRYINGAGTKFEYHPDMGPQHNFLRNFPSEKISHEMAQINHYITKSFDAFLLRRLRGAPQSENTRYDLRFFEKYNQMPLKADHSILRYSDAMRAEYRRLRSIGSIGKMEDEIAAEYSRRLNALEPVLDQIFAEYSDAAFAQILAKIEAKGLMN